MMTIAQCGQVLPFWVQLGWIHWQGHPEKTELLNIEYRRCRASGAMTTTKHGYAAYLCPEHWPMLQHSEDSTT